MFLSKGRLGGFFNGGWFSGGYCLLGGGISGLSRRKVYVGEYFDG